MMEYKIKQNIFDNFDTVEIISSSLRDDYNLNLDLVYEFRGYLLSYEIYRDTAKGCYDSVYIGHYKKHQFNYQFNFMGHNVRMQTTRIVLLEKYDLKLMTSLFAQFIVDKD